MHMSYHKICAVVGQYIFSYWMPADHSWLVKYAYNLYCKITIIQYRNAALFFLYMTCISLYNLYFCHVLEQTDNGAYLLKLYV